MMFRYVNMRDNVCVTYKSMRSQSHITGYNALPSFCCFFTVRVTGLL